MDCEIKNRLLKKRYVLPVIIAFIILAVFITLRLIKGSPLIPKLEYSAEDFGIKTVKSGMDFNKNKVDDFSDFVLGARKDAENKPDYDSSYFDTGYPPEDKGVCTDVIWRAFKNAGYALRYMVDEDIEQRLDEYPAVEKRDDRIDFRRVKNLRVYFEKYALSLTTDINEIAQWQPGDIVIFGEDVHIGLVSDKRNSDGQTLIIHNGGQPDREENYLMYGKQKVTGHYRFDAAVIEKDKLIAWKD